MNSLLLGFKKYLFLIIIFAVFICIAFSYIAFSTRKKGKKNVALRGLLMELNNKKIFALTLVCLNFILETFLLIFKYELNLGIIILSSLMVLIGFILCKNFKNIILNTLINGINLGVIYLGLIINHLEVGSNVLHFILKVAMNAFGLIFYMFILGKFIRNICYKEKHKKNNWVY